MRNRHHHQAARRHGVHDDRALFASCLDLVASGVARRVAMTTTAPCEPWLPEAQALASARGVALAARRDAYGVNELVVGPVRP